MVSSGDGCFRVIADVFRSMILDGCGWFWMLADGLQMVLGGVRWFSVIYSFSSECEIRCLKFKRSRQLWGVFVVHSNNDIL